MRIARRTDLAEDFTPNKREEQLLIKHPAQYLFRDGESYIFMDLQSYQQYTVTAENLEYVEFLKEGQAGFVFVFFVDESRLAYIEFPAELILELVEVQETDANGSKLILGTLETGAILELPRKITVGTLIAVSPKYRKFIRVDYSGSH